MKKFWKETNRRVHVGMIVTIIFLVIGYVVYFFPHTDPFRMSSYPKNLSPSLDHWLGTTSMGQDVVWLLIEAIHNSLTIGIIVATIGTVVGVLVGLLAGFSGGAVDRVLSTITDTFIVIPSLPILILMTSLMKGSATSMLLALVLAMFAWAWPSRQIRSMALSMKERDFIHTAEFSGENRLQIIWSEILPYVLTWSLSNFMNAVLNAIASESSLAVLGLSPANLVSLGNMINWAIGYNAIFMKRFFWIGAPIVATVVMFIGLFLFITGYNDYLQMRRGR